jgi:hypothetical protein
MPGSQNTIILKKPGGKQLMSPGIVSIMDATGFDTVTARYIEQTTAAAVTKANVPGKGPTCPITDGTMVFMGVSDSADLPGDCCEYTLTWRGLLSALPGRDEQVTETRSVRERVFDKISNVPTTGGSVAPVDSKARLLELQGGISVKKITTTKPDPPDSKEANTQSPVQGINTPSRGYDVVNAAKTYCYPHGWICYSWQSEQPIPGIWFVTAEYKYEYPTSSG